MGVELRRPAPRPDAGLTAVGSDDRATGDHATGDDDPATDEGPEDGEPLGPKTGDERTNEDEGMTGPARRGPDEEIS